MGRHILVSHATALLSSRVGLGTSLREAACNECLAMACVGKSCEVSLFCSDWHLQRRSQPKCCCRGLARHGKRSLACQELSSQGCPVHYHAPLPICTASRQWDNGGHKQSWKLACVARVCSLTSVTPIAAKDTSSGTCCYPLILCHACYSILQLINALILVTNLKLTVNRHIDHQAICDIAVEKGMNAEGHCLLAYSSSGAEKPTLQQQKLVPFIDKSVWMGAK